MCRPNHSVTNAEFSEKLKNVNLKDEVMVSSEIIALFTSTDLGLAKNATKELLQTNQWKNKRFANYFYCTHSKFHRDMCEQIRGTNGLTHIRISRWRRNTGCGTDCTTNSSAEALDQIRRQHRYYQTFAYRKDKTINILKDTVYHGIGEEWGGEILNASVGKMLTAHWRQGCTGNKQIRTKFSLQPPEWSFIRTLFTRGKIQRRNLLKYAEEANSQNTS